MELFTYLVQEENEGGSGLREKGVYEERKYQDDDGLLMRKGLKKESIFMRSIDVVKECTGPYSPYWPYHMASIYLKKVN